MRNGKFISPIAHGKLEASFRMIYRQPTYLVSRLHTNSWQIGNLPETFMQRAAFVLRDLVG